MKGGKVKKGSVDRVAKERKTKTTKTRLTKAARQKKEIRVSFFKDLLHRRVPQILGIYFVGHLGIVIFMESLVQNHPLSPHLPTFCLVALASIIPTILLLAYFHGRTGRYQWGRVEKIGVPVNLLVSAVLLFVLFQGKDLGATTKTVTYTDEEGQIVERKIPKSEFRKKVALFYFDNESGDLHSSWLQYGIVKGLEIDLAQDLYLHISYGFSSELREAGFRGRKGVPLTLKKKIAYDRHLDYFVSGSFTKDNEVFSVKTSLYETKRTKLLEKRTFSGTDIFKLIDEMSVQLKHDLKIPAYHIEETEDKPVSEMLTNSMNAFKRYVTGTNLRRGKVAANYFEQAVKEDPTFALAWDELSGIYLFSNQREKAEKAIRAAMQHDYKLSEKYKYDIKFIYYNFIKKDPDQALRAVNTMVELFPQDTYGHKQLAKLYEIRNQPDEAISEYKRILELDPTQYSYLHSLGSIYKKQGEHEEALKYYKRYEEQFPDDPKSFTEIGQLYKTMGEHAQAKAYYKKALLFETGKISVLLTLADIESSLGNFEKALEQYQDTLEDCKTPLQRMNVYGSLRSYYEMRGLLIKALDYDKQARAESEKFKLPAQIIMDNLYILETYVIAGKQELAFETIKEMEEKLAPPWDEFLPLGYLTIYLAMEDADNAEKAIEGVETFIKSFGAEQWRTFIFFAQGMINELRGKYEQAIQSYKKALELEPTDADINRWTGRCYRKLKDFRKAEELIQTNLKIEPFNPKAHYEIALLYWDMGKKEKAMEHLKKALYVWEDADPEFKPAQKAREKLAEWESSNL